jgi:hypothetical protein
LLNIHNKQILQKLITIISPEDKLSNRIDYHKLKVLVRQFKTRKLREKVNIGKEENFFMRVYGQNILDYIAGKESIEHTLKKWLYFTYPTHGQMIAQHLHD